MNKTCNGYDWTAPGLPEVPKGAGGRDLAPKLSSFMSRGCSPFALAPGSLRRADGAAPWGTTGA